MHDSCARKRDTLVCSINFYPHVLDQTLSTCEGIYNIDSVPALQFSLTHHASENYYYNEITKVT